MVVLKEPSSGWWSN